MSLKKQSASTWKKEADSRTEGPVGDVVVAPAGGGVTAERRKEKKSLRGSRLPTLKQYIKH